MYNYINIVIKYVEKEWRLFKFPLGKILMKFAPVIVWRQLYVIYRMTYVRIKLDIFIVYSQ